jgi:hypothetical protein
MEFDVVFTVIWCSSAHATETSCNVASLESINTSNENVGTDVEFGLTASGSQKCNFGANLAGI